MFSFIRFVVVMVSIHINKTLRQSLYYLLCQAGHTSSFATANGGAGLHSFYVLSGDWIQVLTNLIANILPAEPCLQSEFFHSICLFVCLVGKKQRTNSKVVLWSQEMGRGNIHISTCHTQVPHTNNNIKNLFSKISKKANW